MNMNSYKFGFSGLGSSSYYGPSEVNDHLVRMEVSRSGWEYPSTMDEEAVTTDSHSQSEGDAVMGVHAILEECECKKICYVLESFKRSCFLFFKPLI
jgi:E3 ubiquitin-protein ligase BIG BROTHER-like protein